MAAKKQGSPNKALHSARLIGPANVVRAIRNAGKRDKIEAEYYRKPGGEPTAPGRLLTAEAAPGGALFKFEAASLSVRFLAQDFVFLAWDGAEMLPSYAVVKADWDCGADLKAEEGGWVVDGGGLKVFVTGAGKLQVRNAAGRVIRREDPPVRAGGTWTHRACLAEEECVYGLGERAAGLNLRPGKYRMWNIDVGGAYGPGADPLYICMPVFMGMNQSGSYLVFYDNSSEADVSIGDNAEFNFMGGHLRYYIAAGTPQEVLARFSELTGRPAMPPRWSLGYQQSQWGYRTEAEMRRVYKGFKEHNLPLSVLYVDCDSFEGLRTLKLDLRRYPTMPAFAAELMKDGVRLVHSTNPGIKVDKGFDLYRDGLEKAEYLKDPGGKVYEGVVWCGWTAFPDFTSPSVREWWGRQYRRTLNQGMTGFWHDMNEPANFTAWGDPTLPHCLRHDMDGAGGDHTEAHNVYGMLMNRAGWEGLRALEPARRPFILSRSGWVGMQRYSWCWTGDIETSWEQMRQTIPTVLGLALCGLPYSGPDTGGFTGQPDAELYVRWFQLSSMLPFFRTHSVFFLPRREPWTFGQEVLDMLRRALALRYRLMPYWYTLAWKSAQTGEPLAAPLFFGEPHNSRLWKVEDAFMVGDAILAAPVLEEGATSRKVALPGGTWYDIYDDRPFEGGREVEVEGPLDELPLLVRAGSIIPMEEEGGLVLHVYKPTPGGRGRGVLYSDSGDGYGEGRVDTFMLAEDVGGWKLGWKSVGAFEFPYQSVAVRLHGFGSGAVVAVRGQAAAVRDGNFDTGRFENVEINE
jgi:alpha-glucosidase